MLTDIFVAMTCG